MSNEKKQQISAAILARVAAGMNVRAAIDSVLGASTSAALVDSLYEALHQKGGAR